MLSCVPNDVMRPSPNEPRRHPGSAHPRAEPRGCHDPRPGFRFAASGLRAQLSSRPSERSEPSGPNSPSALRLGPGFTLHIGRYARCGAFGGMTGCNERLGAEARDDDNEADRPNLSPASPRSARRMPLAGLCRSLEERARGPRGCVSLLPVAPGLERHARCGRRTRPG